jgi:hypothetical protein
VSFGSFAVDENQELVPRTPTDVSAADGGAPVPYRGVSRAVMAEACLFGLLKPVPKSTDLPLVFGALRAATTLGLCGLTFELTPPVEAGAVSLD